MRLERAGQALAVLVETDEQETRCAGFEQQAVRGQGVVVGVAQIRVRLLAAVIADDDCEALHGDRARERTRGEQPAGNENARVPPASSWLDSHFDGVKTRFSERRDRVEPSAVLAEPRLHLRDAQGMPREQAVDREWTRRKVVMNAIR